jgi:hypothetical protein
VASFPKNSIIMDFKARLPILWDMDKRQGSNFV